MRVPLWLHALLQKTQVLGLWEDEQGAAAIAAAAEDEGWEKALGG